MLNLRRAQRAVVGGGPGPEGNVTKLVLAELGEERGLLQADLVGSDMALLSGDGAFAGCRNWLPEACRSPVGHRR